MVNEATGQVYFPERNVGANVKRASTAIIHIPSKLASDTTFGFKNRTRVKITIIEPGKLLIERIGE